MKTIIGIFLFLIAFAGSFLFESPTFAAEKNETTISVVNVNNEHYFDIEIMLESNGKILLPTKQIADILEVPLKINHSTKEINFDNIRITKTEVFDGDKKISSGNEYLKAGMMDDVRDEIYCDEKTLSQIFKVNITTNKNEMSAKILTDKQLSYSGAEKVEEEKEKSFKAHTDVLIPQTKKRVTFDTIQVDNSMMTDASAQIYQASRQNNYMFNNNSRIGLKGTAYGGDYRADLTTSNYGQKLLSFGGMSFNYKNKFNKTYYEVGKVNGFKDANYQVGTMLIGAQIYDYDTKKIEYKDITGTVDEKSVVNVYVNGDFHSTLSTYKGNYSLKDLYLNFDPLKIAVEEVKEDGTKKIVYEKNYPKRRDGLLEKEQRRSFFAGISGFNDRLFAQDGYIYQMNTKKLVLGAQSIYGFSDNFVSDTKILSDRILIKSPNAIWGQNYYNNNTILSMGTFRNPNTLQGSTIINSMDFYKTDDLKFSSIVAMSQCQDLNNNNENEFGYTLSLKTELRKPKYNLNASVYNQSSDFYLAGSEYGFVSDRLGAKVGGGFNLKGWNFNGGYNKYYSNLNKKFAGGLTDFDEINFNFTGKIKNIAQVRYNYNSRTGQNLIGQNTSRYSDFNIFKVFKNQFTVEAGKQESYYGTEYLQEAEAQNNFSSQYSTIYAKATIPMPKQKGYLELGHDDISYISNGMHNDYKMIKFNYRFPEMKRFLISFGAGYKYTGFDRGLNYNAGIGYRTKSGMLMSINYQYSTNGGYMLDNMYIPTNARHAINFTMNDTYALMPSGLKSVGYSDASKGFVEVVAYLDKNKNGIYDEGDIGVEDVPIKVSWADEPLYTNKKGQVPIATVDQGVYRVNIDNEKLDATLSAAKGVKDSQLLLVQPKKQTNVNFLMTSSVGNIKGHLKIVDDFGRNMNIREFIVVINDEKEEEVAYSTVDDDGNYYFSGIAPGKYKIKLDETFLQANNLVAFENHGTADVDIPFVYKEFVDLKDIDLTYKCW